MTKTITVFDWPGGGTWGLQQLVFAHFLEELSGLSIAEMTDVNFGRSIGAVGATTSLIRDDKNPTQPKFKMSEIIHTFYGVAHGIFGDKDINEHRARGVEHDLKSIQKSDGKQSSVIFRDNSDNMHYNHDLLKQALLGCYNDTKLSQLLKTSVILSRHFETATTVAHTNIDPQTFNPDNWSTIKNLGNDDRVIDAVMCSTAAPTVFDAYSPDGGQNSYIDSASIYGPSDVLLNLKAMADTDIKFRLISLGTGNISNIRHDASKYSKHGFLQMGQQLFDGMAHDVLDRDYARLPLLFPKIDHVFFDTDLSDIQKDGKKYEYTPFDGKVDDLDFIMDTATQSAHQQYDTMMNLIENICETKIRESMPLILSSRITKDFYNLMRAKAKRFVPAKAKKYEKAILKSQETDILVRSAFNNEIIKTMAKGDRSSLRNSTVIPPSALSRILSNIPFIQKKPQPTPALN